MAKKIGTAGTGFIPDENSVMFTESQIGWLRSLVKRGRKNEKSRWDLFEIMTSIGGTLFASGGFSLLTTTFDAQTQQKFIIALWVITIVGVIIGGVGLLMNYRENKEYTSCLGEIDSILQKKEIILNKQENSKDAQNKS